MVIIRIKGLVPVILPVIENIDQSRDDFMLVISHYFDFSLDLTLAGAVGGLNCLFYAQAELAAHIDSKT